ncbi:MAG: hypothetical protein JRJ29_18515 [Deltaproteobacteria bacterium]|nr:hypothetical protein [Deltaproteobacteria bacterium]
MPHRAIKVNTLMGPGAQERDARVPAEERDLRAGSQMDDGREQHQGVTEGSRPDYE